MNINISECLVLVGVLYWPCFTDSTTPSLIVGVKWLPGEWLFWFCVSRHVQFHCPFFHSTTESIDKMHRADESSLVPWDYSDGQLQWSQMYTVVLFTLENLLLSPKTEVGEGRGFKMWNHLLISIAAEKGCESKWVRGV